MPGHRPCFWHASGPEEFLLYHLLSLLSNGLGAPPSALCGQAAARNSISSPSLSYQQIAGIWLWEGSRLGGTYLTFLWYLGRTPLFGSPCSCHCCCKKYLCFCAVLCSLHPLLVGDTSRTSPCCFSCSILRVSTVCLTVVVAPPTIKLGTSFTDHFRYLFGACLPRRHTLQFILLSHVAHPVFSTSCG